MSRLIRTLQLNRGFGKDELANARLLCLYSPEVTTQPIQTCAVIPLKLFHD